LTRLIYGVNKIRVPISSKELTFEYNLGDIMLCQSATAGQITGTELRTLYLISISDPKIMQLSECGVLDVFDDHLVVME